MFSISTGEPPTPPVSTSQRPCAVPTSEPKAHSLGFEDSGRVPSDFEDSGRVQSDFEDSGRVRSSSGIESAVRIRSDLEDSGRIPSDFEDSGIVPSSGIKDAVRIRSDLEDSGRIPSDFEDSGRMPQEPDSGYEASPCSIADACPDSLHFFGEEERPDDVFEDFVLLGGADDDEDCVDCGPNCRCASNSRPESSSAAETVLDGDSNCDSTSSDSSTQHPSSLPIPVPRVNSYRTRPVPSPVVFPFHPRSCPAAWLGQTSPLTRMSEAEILRRRASLQNQRRRRLQIDSDASDVDSSDDNFLSDDGVDNEIFPMADEESEDPRRLVPLPDVVLHSSSSSSSSSVRRSRSASINLPPQPEVLQNIGRSLRRLSEEFQILRETGHARRRQTITSFDRNYRAS